MKVGRSTAAAAAAVLLLCAPFAAASDAPTAAPTVETAGVYGDNGVRGATLPPPPAPTPDEPGEEGDVRLVSEVAANGYTTGAVQLFHSGAWGAVCANDFDPADAAVACRQLGFDHGAPLTDVFPPSTGAGGTDKSQDKILEEIRAPFVLGNLGCNGTEARLVECAASQDTDYGLYYSDISFYGEISGCNPSVGAAYAFVACGMNSGPEEGDLRLAGGETSDDGTAQYGRLEVFAKGGWGTVCNPALGLRPSFFGISGPLTPFSQESADVACQQLGFKKGSAIQPARDYDPSIMGRVPICLGNVACSGGEASLLSCPGAVVGQGVDGCSHDNNVHLVCYTEADPAKDGTLRLEGGDSGEGYEYGRLEVFLRGFWSDICPTERFTPDSAQVACQQLGFEGGAALRFPVSYDDDLAEQPVLEAPLPVALAAVDCDGSEASLLECQRNDERIPRCSNTSDGTVLACGTSTPGCGLTATEQEGSVRLIEGFGTPCDPLYTGFVEVYHIGEWGGICIDRPDVGNTLAADVICRQLGFPHGTPVDAFTPIKPPDTSANASAAAPAPFYGSYYFPDYTDDVVEESEAPASRFWLSSVRCNGPEATLNECNLGPGYRTANRGCQTGIVSRMAVACRQFAVEEAKEAVTTPGAEEGDVRLVGEQRIANWATGRLEVFFEGSWSQVCEAKFDSADADVACRQLGYGAGSLLNSTGTGAGGVPGVVPEAAITLSGCNGDEAALLDCDAERVKRDGSSPTDRGCAGPDSPGLTLACVAEAEQGSERAIRLTGQQGPDADGTVSGILEVFHAGAWGTLCDLTDAANVYFGAYDDVPPPLTESSAVIACRELGYVTGTLRDVVMPPHDAPPSPPLLPPWLSGLQCVGFEESVAQCDGPDFGSTAFCGATQRLFCSNSGGGTGEVRLVGGSEDPDGAWAYGSLEILIDGIWNRVPEGGSGSDVLGRRGADIACKSLGFAAGSQLLAGGSSPLPSDGSRPTDIEKVACAGDEASIADCDIVLQTQERYFFGFDYGTPTDDAVLLCSNPSGCTEELIAPAEGDVRLIEINGTAATASCDAVHSGGVEIFHDGAWGRVCSGNFRPRIADFTLAAKVVCKQLGFPFGGLVDSDEVTDSDYSPIGDYSDYGDYANNELVWATRVTCTGKEASLGDCFFPEAFGEGVYTYDYSGPFAAPPFPVGEYDHTDESADPAGAFPPYALGYAGDYEGAGLGGYFDIFADAPSPSEAAPPFPADTPFGDYAGGTSLPAVPLPGPGPRRGVRASCARRDGLVLAVACRQFEIEESDVIRR